MLLVVDKHSGDLLFFFDKKKILTELYRGISPYIPKNNYFCIYRVRTRRGEIQQA